MSIRRGCICKGRGCVKCDGWKLPSKEAIAQMSDFTHAVLAETSFGSVVIYRETHDLCIVRLPDGHTLEAFVNHKHIKVKDRGRLVPRNGNLFFERT